jgi:Co/Zn/Cd efflux system component
MRTLYRTLAAFAVGIAVFLVTLVALTEALSRYIWLAIVVSFPMAVVAAIFVAGLTFGLLQFRAERAAHGEVTDRTRTAVTAFVAGWLAAIVGAVGAVLVADATLTMGLISATLLVGVPAGLLVGLAAVVTTLSIRGRRRRRTRPTA